MGGYGNEKAPLIARLWGESKLVSRETLNIETLKRARGKMIKPGTVLRDNDPRAPSETRIIVEYQNENRVICRRGKRVVTIRADRIYSDGKPRRSGFDVVEVP